MISLRKFLVGLLTYGFLLAAAHAQQAQAARQPQPPEAQATATGVVFEDRNQNRQRDQGEPGVPNVAVSNGLEVVQTDPQGRYQLSVDNETLVFITKPSGYMVPVNAAQLPQFHYIHYPDGTPVELEYGGIEPTGPLPESVDFPLVKQNESEPFEAVAFSDPQAYNDTELSYVREDITELIGSDAAFGMTVGDIVGDDLSLFERHNAIVSAAGIPWWNLAGNHDMNYDAANDKYALETYKRVYGPPNYSFDYGQTHFVMLDNIDYLGDEDYRTGFSEAQLQWLENDLSLVPEDKQVVLAMHAPLIDDNLVNRERFFEVIEGREHLFSFAGHWHTARHDYLGEEEGFDGPEPLHHHTLAAVSGHWWAGPEDDRGVAIATQNDGTPNGYYMLSFDGNTYAERFQAASEPASYQMRIAFDRLLADPSILNAGQWQAPTLVVNVFDGSERSTVRYQINGGRAVAMTHVERLDPYITWLYERYPDDRPEAGTSQHIWEASLPERLEPGVHTVTVTTRDQFGQEHQASEVFEVAADEQAAGQGY